MKFFQINLNKLEDRGEIEYRQRRERAVFACIQIILLLLLSGSLFIHFKLEKKIRVLKNVSSELRDQIRNLEQSKNYIGEADVRSLKQLEGKRVFWADKLEDLAKLVGDQISITGIHYFRGKLFISGIAKASPTANHFNLISDFVERLKASRPFSRDFKRIEFGSSQRVNFLDQDILVFELICNP